MGGGSFLAATVRIVAQTFHDSPVTEPSVTTDPPTVGPVERMLRACPKEKKSVVIVMPAYNAARRSRAPTRHPHDGVDKIILADDVSRTRRSTSPGSWASTYYPLAEPGLRRQPEDVLPGGAEDGADIVVMLHPDNQYDATRIPELIAPIVAARDIMLGSRFLGDTLAGGMPTYKFLGNRFLTGVQNLALGLRLCEYHSGFRAYSRRAARDDPFPAQLGRLRLRQEMIAQARAVQLQDRRDRGADALLRRSPSVSFRRSVVYGLGTLRLVGRYLLHRLRVRRSPKLTARPPGAPRADLD